MAMAANGTATSLGPERRVASRCNIVDLHLVSVDLAFQSGALMLDLSETGMGVQALMRMPQQGATTELHFRLPQSDVRVDGVGTVAWTDDSGRLGIRFDELAEMCRPHLAQWLSRQRRSQLAPGAGVPGQDEVALLRRDLLAQELQGDEALAFVLERTVSLTGATGAAIAMRDADTGAFLCRASSGAAPAVGATLDPSSGLSGECVRTAEVVRCDDTETDPRVDSMVCRKLDLRSAVIVPVKEQTRLLGVLEVFSSRALAFPSSAVLLLREIAALVAELTTGKPAAAAVIAAATVSPAAAAVIAAPVLEATTPPPAAFAALETVPEAPIAESPATARWIATPALRLKVLLAALAVTMLAASAWTGWRWGRSHLNSQPAPAAVASAAPQSSSAVAPSLPVPATLAAPEAPVVTSPDPAPAAPKPVPRKKAPPMLILLGSPSPTEVSAPEPPPTITLRPSDGTDAAGLGAVLASTTATAPLPKPRIVSQGVTGGRLIRKIEPDYPLAARNLRLNGAVVLRASVDVRGRVTKVTVLKGSPLLAGAAANAVKGWRYEPFLLNGVAIPNDVTVEVRFAARE